MNLHSARELARCLFFDLLGLWLALALAEYLRWSFSFGSTVDPTHVVTPAIFYVVVPIVWFVGFYWAQVYHQRRVLNFQLEIAHLALGQFYASLLFCGVLYITFREYSRLQTLYVIIISFIILGAHRIIYAKLSSYISLDGQNVGRIAVVGTDETAQRFTEVIARNQPANLILVGHVVRENEHQPNTSLQIPVLGTIDSLAEIIVSNRITEIIVSTSRFNDETVSLIEETLRQVEAFRVSVRLLPDYTDITYFHRSTSNLYGMPLIGLRDEVFTPFERLLKRLIDISVSAIVLVLSIPLFVVIALLIRLDSPGPVLLAQERIGLRGHRFRMYKFRSMRYEKREPSPSDRLYNVVKVRDDPRITRVGRILRRTSMDELPQFFNVLKGEMSLVGPRPEVPEMVNKYKSWQRKRFDVPQGMTGWWQINGRADRPMYYHIADDLYYIRNYSLWLDLWILFRTVFVVILGRGAY